MRQLRAQSWTRRLPAVLLTLMISLSFLHNEKQQPCFGDNPCIPLCIILREGCEPAPLWHGSEGVYGTHWPGVLAILGIQILDKCGIFSCPWMLSDVGTVRAHCPPPVLFLSAMQRCASEGVGVPCEAQNGWNDLSNMSLLLHFHTWCI